MAKKPKKVPRKLPVQVLPKLISVEYAKALVKGFIDPIRKAYAPLVDEVRKVNEAAIKAKEGEKTDADPTKKIKKLLAQGTAAVKASFNQDRLESLATQFAERTQTHQRIQLGRQVKAVLGADPTFDDPRLGHRIGTFVKDNVILVKRIPVELHDDLEDLIEDGAMGGWLGADLAEQIEERFDISERHARLIANDQVKKLYSNVNHDRQREMGVEKFVWRTVHDERVRGDPDGLYPKAEPSHFDLDGQVFSYDDPPVDDNGEPFLAGDPVNCRCYAEPILDDLEDDEEEEGDEEGDDEEGDEEDRDDSADVLSLIAFDVSIGQPPDERYDQAMKECWVELFDDFQWFRLDSFNPDQPRAPNGQWSSGSGSLPEEHTSYFKYGQDAKLIPVSSLRVSHVRPLGIEHARERMVDARNGLGEKRLPIRVSLNPDGTYTIEDGNSTVAIAKANGWKTIPATVTPTSIDVRKKAYMGVINSLGQDDKVSTALGKLASVRGGLENQLKIAKVEIEAHARNLPEALNRLRGVVGPAAIISGRTKSLGSAIEKEVRKPKYEDVSKLQDLTGMRVVTTDLAQTRAAVDRIRQNYKVVEEDDYNTRPKEGGYRAHHMIVVDTDGKQKEIQIQTQRQRAFQKWSHPIYKPETPEQAMSKGKYSAELDRYATQVSARLNAQDRGVEYSQLPEVTPLPHEAEKAFGRVSGT